jgi:transposase
MHHSTAEKFAVTQLLQSGVPAATVSTQLRIPLTTVYNIKNVFNARGTVEAMPRSGRPKKMSPRDTRELVRIVKGERRATLGDITNSLSTSVSRQTVRNTLKEVGIRSRIAAKKPFLSTVHRQRRLEFARKHQDWTVEDWRKVIWCDESTFEIGKNSRQVRVWRTVDEKYSDSCLAPSFKSGRSSLMIWGAICGSCKSELAFMDRGRRTAVDYVDMVYQGPLLDMMCKVSGAVLMEDGAMIHRSNAPKQWRELYMLSKLEWPAQSPDLNPIENMWKQMKDAIQNRSPRVRTLEEMRQTLTEVWQGLNEDVYVPLIISMPDRIKAVIEAKGGSTRW